MSKKNNKIIKSAEDTHLQANLEPNYLKWMKLMPLILMVSVVPFIVRLRVIPLREELQAFWPQEQVLDQYAYYKSYIIMIIVVYMLVIAFLYFKKKDFAFDKTAKIILSALGIFILLTFVSAIFSDYLDVAFWGGPDRREGLVMQACYIIMMIYALVIIKDQKYFKYVTIAISVMTAGMFIIGISQIMGKNILVTDTILKLILPSDLHNQMNEIKTLSDMVYLTMGNSNFVGSLVAMLLPFFASLLLIPNVKIYEKIMYAILLVFSLVILVGSRSQAGIVGILLALILLSVIFFRQIFTNKKILAFIVAMIIIVPVGANVATQGRFFDSVIDIFDEAGQILKNDDNFDPTYGLPIYSLETDGFNAKMGTKFGDLNINLDKDGNIKFTDSNGSNVNYQKEEGDSKVYLDAPYSDIQIFEANKVEGLPDALVIGYDGVSSVILEINPSEGIFLINTTYRRIDAEPAPYIGFEGNERLGSARGYIWSRTIPMLKDTLLIGHGPDNYLMNFPQNDYFAKLYSYDTPFIIVDKPHNIYLQYGVNSGVLATLALMAAWGIYIIDSIKMYFGKRKYTEGDIYGIACMASVVGYLGSGMFNDSVVSVAPLFWIIFGCGIAMNYINKQNETELN